MSEPRRSREAPGNGDALAPVGRTLALARPAAGREVLVALLGAGAIAADIGLLGAAAWLISRAAEHPNESALGLAIVAVQFFGLSRGFFRYAERVVGHDAAFRLLAELRVRMYGHLERLAPAGLPAFRRGDLLARVVRDVDSLQDLVVRVVPVFGASALVGVLTVAVTWWLLPAAGLVLALALLPAATVVPWLTGSLARRRERRFAGTRGSLTAAVVDLEEGAAELIAFGAAGAQLETIRQHDAELTRIAAASAGTAGIGLGLTTLLSGAACWGGLLAGIVAVRSGRLHSADLAVVTLIPLAAFELVVGLPVATQALHRVRQAAARVFEVFDAASPVPDADTPATLPDPPYDICCRGISAHYPGGSSPVLRGVDLALPAGRRTAVVGASGAGKSTLAAVLAKLLALQDGAISLNRTPTEQLAGDDVRRVVGLAPQDPYFFDTTLAENLRLGNRRATDDELRTVLARLGLAGWLDGLPAGLDTPVGRHGTRLSGGQRQRLAVARSLIADLPVQIYDEPAEHLDPDAADDLIADLLTAAPGRSVLLITHRVSALGTADDVLIMTDGRIVPQRSLPTEARPTRQMTGSPTP